MSLTARFYTVDKSPRSTRLPSSAPVRYQNISLQGETIEADNAAPLPLRRCIGELQPSQPDNEYGGPWAGGDGPNKFDSGPNSFIRLDSGISREYVDGKPRFVQTTDSSGRCTWHSPVMFPCERYQLITTWWTVRIKRYPQVEYNTDNTAIDLYLATYDAEGNILGYTPAESGGSSFNYTNNAVDILNLERTNTVSTANVAYIQLCMRVQTHVSVEGAAGSYIEVDEIGVSFTAEGSDAPYENNVPINSPSAPAILRRDVDGLISDWRLETFPDGFFGGYFNAIRGRLVNQWIEIPSYAGEELPAEWMSSLDVYEEGTTPTLGAQVVYKASGGGTAYQVQPWDVRTLQGDNVLTWSGGDLDVTYTAYRSTTPPVPLELPIDIKYPTDILHPELMLNFASSPVDFNYLYLPAFDRYYWLNGWQSVSNGLWSVTGTVDELASWRDEILDLNLYVLRAASEGDGRIIDNLYPAVADVSRQILFTDRSPWAVEMGITGFYVVSICGSGETAYYAFTPSQYKAFFDELLGDDYIDSVMSYLQDWETVYPQAKLEINPLQYVAGVKWFAFSTITDVGATSVDTIPVGMASVDCRGYKLPSYAVTVAYDRTIPINSIHPQSARGVYLNLAPYSHIQAYVPPFGLVTINPATALAAQSVRLTIAVDLRSGDGALRLLTPDGAVETELHAPVGVSVAIGQTLTAGYGLLDAAGAAAGIGASIMSGNVAGVITGASSAIGNLIASQVPTSRTIGSPESIGALRGPLVVYSDHYAVAEEDITHRGRPLCANRRLGDLTGYVLVADADFTIPCTEEENNQIRAFLEGGVFIE